MASDLFFRLLLLLIFFTGAESTVPGPSPAAGSVTPPGGTPLTQALRFAPLTAGQVYFTDWARLKTYEGAEQVDSTRPIDERIDFLLSIGRTQAAASGFALAYAAEQGEQWGWDSTDLLWEATIAGDGPPVYVLRLRDDLDLDALIARFEEREFVRRNRNGALVFSHALDPAAPWRTELAVFNAAILPDAHILMHSSSADAIDAVLDAYFDGDTTWAASPAAVHLAGQLGPTAAAALALGPDVCTGLGSAQIVDMLTGSGKVTEVQVEALKRQLAAGEAVHPYLALGIGYTRDATGALGTVAMVYATPAQATADLETRRALAGDGVSVATGAPYRDSIFALEEGTAVETALLLHLRPHDDRPQRLFDMLYRRDMTFAACP